MGIDGRIYPVGTARLSSTLRLDSTELIEVRPEGSSPKSKPTEAAAKGKKGENDHMFSDDWFPVQVKLMDKVVPSPHRGPFRSPPMSPVRRQGIRPQNPVIIRERLHNIWGIADYQ